MVNAILVKLFSPTKSVFMFCGNSPMHTYCTRVLAVASEWRNSKCSPRRALGFRPFELTICTHIRRKSADAAIRPRLACSQVRGRTHSNSGCGYNSQNLEEKHQLCSPPQSPHSVWGVLNRLPCVEQQHLRCERDPRRQGLGQHQARQQSWVHIAVRLQPRP